jgi:UDPglucose 6-dehydrogenase
MRHLYAPFLRTNDRLQFMDPRSAELTKYASNALLASRISFMNELANLAERVGADIELVRRGVGADPRIGPKFLFPGPGFGGSCFPKDIKALLHTAKEADVPLEVVAASDRANARQKQVLAGKIERHFGGVAALAGKTVAVWGLAFKPATDDIRESPALALIDRLLAAGARVTAHDPAAMENVSAIYGDRVTMGFKPYDALHAADALALVTEWHEYRRPDFARIKKAMRAPVLFDGRNVWDPGELRALGFTYYGIGRQ